MKNYKNTNQILKKVIVTALFISLIASPMLVNVRSVQAERIVQAYNFTKRSGGTASDLSYSVAVDGSNNVYMAGIFSGTVNFNTDGGTDSRTSAGSNDIFVTKINSDGSYGWTKTAGGTGLDIAYGITVDGLNNIYVTGTFGGTVNFNTDGGTDNKVSAGSNDLFIMKLNSDGSYGWTKRAGGSGLDVAYSVTTDGSNNVYVVGSFTGTANFNTDGGTDNLSAGGIQDDIFVMKLNSDGSYAWTERVGANTADTAFSVTTDGSNNVYVAGRFTGTVNFNTDGGTSNLTSLGTDDIAIMKINSDGSYGWAKRIGGTGSDMARGITTDSLNNIYITGFFNGTVNFNTDGGTDNKVSSGGNDVFITKLNSDGSYGWTKKFGGSAADIGFGIATDGLNNIYTAGSFSSTVNFNTDGGTDSKTSAGLTDIFVSKLNNDGSYDWSRKVGGTSDDIAYGVAGDSVNNLYVSGGFSVNFNFNTDGGTDNKTSAGSNDIFLTKIIYQTYHHIVNLPPTLVAKVQETLEGVSNVAEDDGVLQGESTTILIKKTDTPIADVEVTFSDDLDFSVVTADTDTDLHKSFAHNVTSAQGASSTFSLYVPYDETKTSVLVCPGADSLDEISPDCVGAIVYNVGDEEVEIVTINSEMYWKISGLTGTGGMSYSIPVPTPVTIPAPNTSGQRTAVSSAPLSVAEIQKIFGNLAQIQSTTTTPTTTSTPTTVTTQLQSFARNLQLNSRGEDVRNLQRFLNQNGFTVSTSGAGSSGNETTVFGPATRRALIRYQQANKITPAVGFFGPITRATVRSK
jgi:hypothetical protein